MCEVTFRVEKLGYGIGLGVVPAMRAGYVGFADTVGYMFLSNGGFYAQKSSSPPTTDLDVGFGTEDFVSVCLDVRARTVTFRKNGCVVLDSYRIPWRKAGYRFAFTANCEGAAVTIVKSA